MEKRICPKCGEGRQSRIRTNGRKMQCDTCNTVFTLQGTRDFGVITAEVAAYLAAAQRPSGPSRSLRKNPNPRNEKMSFDLRGFLFSRLRPGKEET